MFAHCPVSNPKVTACLYSSVAGTFQIGQTVLQSTTNSKLSLGLISTAHGNTVVLPNDGSPGLVAQPIPLPGGLLGIPGAPSGGPLQVTAQPLLAGVPTLNLTNLLTGHGTAITLPLQVLVANPLLGPSCTIGTTSAPLTVNLTDGTTSPPPPNTPISGVVGTISGTKSGLLTLTGNTLVDNAFATPGASGCGPFGLFDFILNLQKHLPSPAGNNSAILSGTTTTAPASLIRKYIG